MSEQVICLSDSDEEWKVSEKNDEMDFDFPSIAFAYGINGSESINKHVEKNEALPKVYSVSDVEESDDDSLNDNRAKSATKESDESQTSTIVSSEPAPKISRAKRTKNPSDLFETEKTKTAKRSKEQDSLDKRIKILERKHHKNIQPNECMKFMRVNMDKDLENFSFCPEVLAALRNSDISCRYESLLIPNSITWNRKVESCYINDDNEACEKTEDQMEKQIIVILNWVEAVRKIHDGSFVSFVASLVSILPNQRYTMVLYGMEHYFGNREKSKKQMFDKNTNCLIERLPNVTHADMEICLAEIQLTLQCNSRLIETAQELALLVQQFTKAIAEIPYKLEKRQRVTDKIDWYATGDNRDTVKVDKNTNGLKRLWQQQLCQFNLATLETVEAIASAYTSPQELMQAYDACTPIEGEKLLKDIPIRRAAGPLSIVRKIGPELSKKVYIMFTSRNGETTLGYDREL